MDADSFEAGGTEANVADARIDGAAENEGAHP